MNCNVEAADHVPDPRNMPAMRTAGWVASSICSRPPHCSGGEARPPRGAESAQALRCADRGHVLGTGTIVLTGSGEALLKSNEVQVVYLGGAAKFRA